MEHKIWNPKWECATREEKNQIQLERLKKITAYCYERVPFYKKKFDEIGLKPDHIKTLKDVRLLPFTTALERAYLRCFRWSDRRRIRDQPHGGAEKSQPHGGDGGFHG